MSNGEEKDLRTQQIEARRQMMADLKPHTERVRVTAANETLRKVLKHPNGVKFPSGGGSVDWPLDQFTRRRIAEGAVNVEQGEKGMKLQERRRAKQDQPLPQAAGATPTSQPRVAPPNPPASQRTPPAPPTTAA